MKILINTVSAMALFSISGLAMAEQCPDKLNADEMYDCIVQAGASNTFEAVETRNDEQVKAVYESTSTQQAATEKSKTHAGL